MARATRRLSPLLFSTMLVVAAPAGAQTADDDPYAPLRNGTSTTNRSNSGQQAARDAAASQAAVPPPTMERYRPDAIGESVRTRDSSSRRGDDETADVRRGVDERPDDRRTLARPLNEFERFVSQVVDKPLRRFGSNLLVPAARGYTAPPTTTIPPDYRINPGDELVVGLTGSVQASNLRLIVDPEGRIFIPNIGSVTVGGVRYGDVQSTVARQVSRQYRSFRVAVTIGQLHGITVYVTGFAATPGSYTLSSLSTLVNAVLAAGGPSVGGSFRSIQVRRGGRLISDFDLYDFLLKGDKSADVVLQNGDVVYIAPAGAQVGVIGSVNFEAIYESRAGETLTAMLLYAGGINTVADDTRLLVLDPLGGAASGWQLVSPASARTLVARRGQIIRVLSDLGIVRPVAQQPVLVTVSGEVAKPGNYYVPPNTTLASVLAEAGGLTPQAYPFASVFTRESVRNQQRRAYDRALSEIQFLLTAQPLTTPILSQSVPQGDRLQAVQAIAEQLAERKPDGRVVFDVAPGATVLPGSIILENNDTLFVPTRPVTAGVFGLVANPASFAFVPGSTVGDLLARAGGAQRIGDRRHIFVIRANGAVVAGSRKALLRQPALPGDVVFVPIDASRGEFFARLRDLTTVLSSTALTAAAIATVAK